VKLLLTKAVNTDGKFNGLTPLHYACIGGHIEIVKLLMNTDINALDSELKSPFFHACIGVQTEIVKLLISRDDLLINAESYDGLTAFHCVCSSGYVEMVKLLMSRADININAESHGVRDENMRGNLSTNNFVIGRHCIPFGLQGRIY